LVVAAAFVAACSSTIPCSIPRDCPVAQRCVNGGCVDPDGTPGALGEACRANADCPSGLSCSTASQGYPGGFCTVSCTAAAACGTGAACTPITTTSQLCTPTCTSDSQCRQGYGCCLTLGDTCVPLAACTPPACTRPVVSSALPAAQVQSFGTKTVGEEVVFTVLPGTGSVTIVQQAQIATMTIVYQNRVVDNSAVPLTITKPNDGGLAFYDLDAGVPSSPDGGIDPSGLYADYRGGTPSTVAFTIPNTSASLTEGVPAGDWRFKVSDWAYECTLVSGCTDGGTAANTYEVSVLTRPSPGGTNLDVAVYIAADMSATGGVPFTAANAVNDPKVKQMVSTFQKLLAGVDPSLPGVPGINASVTFYDLSATERARFGTNISVQATGPCAELSQLFTLSGKHPGNTMNLFLVQGLRDASSGGGQIVGIDGTIPGPSSLNGTVSSGAVVSASDLFGPQQACNPAAVNIAGCGPDRVAYIAAHETGHFLGLFHTTEQEGADFDPLTDTPKCPCTTCSSAPANCTLPGAPFMAADRCVSPPSCGGGNNLMFWILQSGISSGYLSSQQAQVMRLNPLVQ
jgi:hypothetical protein